MLGPIQVLNPRPAERGRSPVELSRELLGEARALTDPDKCARLDALAGQLHGVAAHAIEGDAARIAFWANLYNALVLHCLCLRPLRGNLLRHLRRIDRVGYRVGDLDYPLGLIENGILRANRRPPLRLRRPLADTDARLASAVGRLDPRIHFALNCGARSCPAVRAYSPASLDAELEAATRAYLGTETELDPGRSRVRLPRLMRIYRADFGSSREQLEFAAQRLPELRRWVEGGGRVRVSYGHFDWTITPDRSALSR